MKYFIIATVVILAIFQIAVVLDSPSAREHALAAGFTPDQIQRAADFTVQRKLIGWPGVYLHFAVLLLLARYARQIADGCARLVRGQWLLTLLLVGVVCALAQEAVDLPQGLAFQALLHSWDLSHRAYTGWLVEHFTAFVVFGGIGAVVLLGFYALMRWLPRTWWIVCSLSLPLLSIAIAYLYPIVLAPIFNTFTPLDQTKYAQFAPGVKKVLHNAGIDYGDLLVMDGSRQSGHTNAYFTGWGSSRRIVLFDTLLEKHSEAEVESILAHELGHWQHHHIVKGIALGSFAGSVGFLLLFLFLKYLQGRPPWLLRSAADPASVPIVLLCISLGQWATMPLQNTISRYFERQADERSLELAGPEPFIAAERKLALDNISNLAPHPLAVFLLNTHPTPVERIEMAKEFKR